MTAPSATPARGYPDRGLRAAADRLEAAESALEAAHRVTLVALSDALADNLTVTVVCRRLRITENRLREHLRGHRPTTPTLLREIASHLPAARDAR